MVITIEACAAFLTLWIVCELGQRVTDIFASINGKFEEFAWYSYPKAMQRMLPTILITVQKPVDIKCFGSFAANREGYRKVRIIPDYNAYEYKIYFC